LKSTDVPDCKELMPLDNLGWFRMRWAVFGFSMCAYCSRPLESLLVSRVVHRSLRERLSAASVPPIAATRSLSILISTWYSASLYQAVPAKSGIRIGICVLTVTTRLSESLVASNRNGYKRHPSLKVGDNVGLAPVLIGNPARDRAN
jgi:hypothetical protein